MKPADSIGGHDLQTSSKRSEIVWLFTAISIPWPFIFLTPVTKYLFDGRSCPVSAIACWSTGFDAFLGLIPAVSCFVIALVWLKVRKCVTATFKIFVSAAAGASLLLTGYGLFRDGDQFDAITGNGLISKDPGAPAKVYPWKNVTGVTTWCETGSRSGPWLEVFFTTQDGREFSYRYERWVNLTRANQTLVSDTDSIPYRIKNFQFCSNRYDYLPSVNLNHAPDWFPQKPPNNWVLIIMVTMIFTPAALLVCTLVWLARRPPSQRPPASVG